MLDDAPEHVILSEDDLRARFAAPGRLAIKKQLDHLDHHCRRFIALSPFLCLATARPDGLADNSPRGDAPGFVLVADERTLVIPDRPGNNRLDSQSNIIHNPNVGLLFFIPGVTETLRVNGHARISSDPDLLARFEVNGRQPKVAIAVTVVEAFLHCSKALIRSRLWEEDAKVDRKVLPTLGRMIADVADREPNATIVAEYEERIERNARDERY